MSLEDLERRIQVLEDIEAIKRVTFRYLNFCDDNYNPDGIASCFSEDGVREDNNGRHEGRETVRALFARSSERTTFAVHMGLNPIITVNGDEAHGSWYTFLAMTVKRDGEDQAMWRAGRYENDYVRVNGQWLIKLMKSSETFFTPFDQGWVKLRSITGGA